MRKLNLWCAGCLLACLGGLLVAPAMAGLDDFKLARAIPADAAVAVHSRTHAGQQFVTAQFERVWAEVQKQRFDRELKKLCEHIADQMDQSDVFEERWQQVSGLLEKVDWCGLCSREFAFGLRLDFPVPGIVLIATPDSAKLDSNFEGLVGLATALTKLSGDETFTHATEGTGPAATHRWSVAGVEGATITLARTSDSILLGLGALATQSLGLLRGESGQPLAGSERFKSAFKTLPPPQDSYTFADIASLLRQERTYIGEALKMGGKEVDEEFAAIPGKIIDAIDMWDYVASSVTTDGMRTTDQTITVLRADAKSKPAYKALYGNPALKDPLKYVPKNAKDVSANSGIDVLALYRAITGFISENIPDGADMVSTLKELPIDIETDVCGWIGGGFTNFSVPSTSAFGPGDWVIMVTLRDEKKAAEMIEVAATHLQDMLEQQNGGVEDADVEGAEGFRRVFHPMLAMVPIGQPTFGIHDGILFIGSGPKVLSAALATGRGEAENFSKNERFTKEGMPIASNVVAVSYSDMTSFGEELGSGLQMAGSMLAFIPDATRNPVVAILRPLLIKAGNVVRKFDFYLSSFSQSTMDGDTIKATTIYNYREPPRPSTPAEPEKSDSAEKPKN